MKSATNSAICAAIIFVFAASQSMALDCNQVRDVVKKLGRDKSEQLAKLVGATPAMIAEGRHCFRKAK